MDFLGRRVAYAEGLSDAEKGAGFRRPEDGAGAQKGELVKEEAEQLLDCPCLDDLKAGPCGENFKEAFRCFILSNEEEKGVNCKGEFTKLETCMASNTHLFTKKDQVCDDEKAVEEAGTIPPVSRKGIKLPNNVADWSKT